MKLLTLPINGGALDCLRFGAGGKPLILLPGLSLQTVKGAVLPLAYLYRLFSKEYTVYILDKKSIVPEGYTLQDLTKDTAAAMDLLNLRSADIFGVSLGGMIAQYLAASRPDLTRKMVLAVTASRPNETMQKVANDWIAMAEQRKYAALTADILEKMYSPAYLKKYRPLTSFLAKLIKQKNLNRFIALAKSCLTCNAYAALDKISCSVFVIGGKQDAVVTSQASEELAAKLRCKMYLYSDLGHAAYEEAPDFNRRVYQFLTE